MQRQDQPPRPGQQGPPKRVKEMSWMELEAINMAEQFENALITAVKLRNHQAALGYLTQLRYNTDDGEKQRLLNKAFYIALEHTKDPDLDFALEMIKMGAKPYADENGIIAKAKNGETNRLGLGQFISNMWGSDISGKWKKDNKKYQLLKALVTITLNDGYGWVLNTPYTYRYNDQSYIRTYLTQTISNNDDNSVEILLNAGADPNSTITGKNTRTMMSYVLDNFKVHIKSQGYNKDSHHFAERILRTFLMHPNMDFKQKIDSDTNESIYQYIRNFEGRCKGGQYNDIFCHRPTLYMQQVLEKRTRPGLVRTLSDKAIAVRPEHERQTGERFDADGERLPPQPEDDYKWTTDMRHIPEADKFSLPPPIWMTILMQSRRMQLCKNLQDNVNLDKVQALANILRIHLDIKYKDDKGRERQRPKTKTELCERISRALAEGSRRWDKDDEKRFRKYLEKTEVDYDRAVNEMKRLAVALGINPEQEDYMKQLEIAMKDRILNK